MDGALFLGRSWRESNAGSPKIKHRSYEARLRHIRCNPAVTCSLSVRAVSQGMCNRGEGTCMCEYEFIDDSTARSVA